MTVIVLLHLTQLVLLHLTQLVLQRLHLMIYPVLLITVVVRLLSAVVTVAGAKGTVMRKKSLTIATLLASLATLSVVPAVYASPCSDSTCITGSCLCGCSASPVQTDTPLNSMDDTIHSVNEGTGATVAGDCDAASCFAGCAGSTTTGGEGGWSGPGTINQAIDEEFHPENSE